MPFYFAYGANMDVEAMRQRCPASVPLGPACLAGFSFFISEDGFASVRRHAGGEVHGLGWTLALRDVPALDRYEEVATGLYRKALLPIRLGAKICTALVYVGRGLAEGTPAYGYLDTIIAAAERLELPAAHVEELRCWHRASRGRRVVHAARSGGRGGSAFGDGR